MKPIVLVIHLIKGRKKICRRINYQPELLCNIKYIYIYICIYIYIYNIYRYTVLYWFGKLGPCHPPVFQRSGGFFQKARAPRKSWPHLSWGGEEPSWTKTTRPRQFWIQTASYRVVDLALNQSQTLVSPIFKFHLWRIVSENILFLGTNLQPWTFPPKKNLQCLLTQGFFYRPRALGRSHLVHEQGCKALRLRLFTTKPRSASFQVKQRSFKGC